MRTRQKTSQTRRNRTAPNRASVLLYLVVILTVFSVLGAAMLSLSVTSKETLLSANAAHRAYFLAESALRIAQRQYCKEGEIPSPLTLQFLSGETAIVTALPAEAGFSVTATAHPGAPHEARAQVFGSLPECEEEPPPIPGETPDDYVIYTGGGGDGGGGGGSGFVLPSGGNVSGSVFGYTVTIQPNVDITENVISSTSVTIGSGTEVGGYICAAAGNVELLSAGIVVAGNIYAFGNVIIGSNASVLGNIYANGYVELKNSNAFVGGDIHAGGAVIAGSSADIRGNVYAGGAITIDSEADFGGSIYSGDSVHFLNRNNVIDGDVYAAANITIHPWSNSVIHGNSYAGGSFNQYDPSSIFQPFPPEGAPLPPTGCPPEPPPPQMQTFIAGSEDFDIPQNGSRTIPHGAYRNVTIRNNSTVILRAGNCSEVGQPGCYTFNSFEVVGGGSRTLRLDFSTGDYITVFCVGNIIFTGPIEVSLNGIDYININTLYANSPELARQLARRVYWETHSTFTVGSHNSTRRWFGTVLSQREFPSRLNFFGIGAFATVDGQISIADGSNTIIFEIADFAYEHWLP